MAELMNYEGNRGRLHTDTQLQEWEQVWGFLSAFVCGYSFDQGTRSTGQGIMHPGCAPYN